MSRRLITFAVTLVGEHSAMMAGPMLCALGYYELLRLRYAICGDDDIMQQRAVDTTTPSWREEKKTSIETAPSAHWGHWSSHSFAMRWCRYRKCAHVGVRFILEERCVW